MVVRTKSKFMGTVLGLNVKNVSLRICFYKGVGMNIDDFSKLKELIEERTGVKPGTTGGMFQLNPFV